MTNKDKSSNMSIWFTTFIIFGQKEPSKEPSLNIADKKVLVNQLTHQILVKDYQLLGFHPNHELMWMLTLDPS